MTTTPKSIGDDSLAESWVDVTVNSGRVTPVSAPTGLINGSPVNNGGGNPGQFSAQITEEYLRLLKEAQREGNYSSSRVSLASSRRESRCESPKSPPNSPNNELATATGDEELKGIFINKDTAEHTKEWMMSYWTASKGKAKLSLRHTKCGGKGLFSRDVMFTLFLSNLLSLLIGAGIGLWISKRPTSVISQISLN